MAEGHGGAGVACTRQSLTPRRRRRRRKLLPAGWLLVLLLLLALLAAPCCSSAPGDSRRATDLKADLGPPCLLRNPETLAMELPGVLVRTPCDTAEPPRRNLHGDRRERYRPEGGRECYRCSPLQGDAAVAAEDDGGERLVRVHDLPPGEKRKEKKNKLRADGERGGRRREGGSSVRGTATAVAPPEGGAVELTAGEAGPVKRGGGGAAGIGAALLGAVLSGLAALAAGGAGDDDALSESVFLGVGGAGSGDGGDFEAAVHGDAAGGGLIRGSGGGGGGAVYGSGRSAAARKRREMDPANRRETGDEPRSAVTGRKGLAFGGAGDADGPGARPPSTEPPGGGASGTAGSVPDAGNEWDAHTTAMTFPELGGGVPAVARRLQADTTDAPAPTPDASVPSTPAPMTDPTPAPVTPPTEAPVTAEPITTPPVTTPPVAATPVPATVTPTTVTQAPVTAEPITTPPVTTPPVATTPAPATVTPTTVTQAPVTAEPITTPPVTTPPVATTPAPATVTPTAVTLPPVTGAPMIPPSTAPATETPAPAPAEVVTISPTASTPPPTTTPPAISTPHPSVDTLPPAGIATPGPIGLDTLNPSVAPAPTSTSTAPQMIPTQPPSLSAAPLSPTTVAPSGGPPSGVVVGTPGPTESVRSIGSAAPAATVEPSATADPLPGIGTPEPSVTGTAGGGTSVAPGETHSPGTTVSPVDVEPLPTPTLSPLPAGETHSPGTTVSPVDVEPLPTPTLSPLPAGETHSPGTTVSPVDVELLPTPTLSPLPAGETHSPGATVSPVNVEPLPTPTLSPLPAGETHSPGATVSPVAVEPLPTPTLSPLPAGETHSPGATVSPVAVEPLPTPTLSPLPAGETHSPGATVSPVAVEPLPTPTLSPLAAGETHSPATTLAPASPIAQDPLQTSSTLSPLAAGETHSPATTLAPANPIAQDPVPTSTLPPLPAGETHSPATTVAPASPIAQDPLQTSSTLSPLAAGETHSPATTLAPVAGGTPGVNTTEPVGTPSPDATGGPAEPTPLPTAMPTNTTAIEEVLDTTGETASGAVVVAVAATGAAATVSSITATTAAATSTVSTAATTAAAATAGASGAGGAASGSAVAATTAAGGGGAAPGAAVGGGAAAGGGGTTTAASATTAAVESTTATATAAAESTAVAASTTTGATTTTATGATTTATGTGATSGATTGAGTTGGTGGTTGGTGGTTIVDNAGVRQATGNANTGQSGGGGGGTEATSTAQETATDAVSTDPGTVSSRSPSATLGLLMIFQIQFLSSLRLLEANITAPFRRMLDQLKWLNLHFDVDFVGFAGCDDEDSFTWTEDDNGMWAFNTFAVFGFMALLILCHILLLSYIEASWLSQANAIHRHRLERRRGRTNIGQTSPDVEVSKAHHKFLDDDRANDDLDEQDERNTERYLIRHNSVWIYFPHVELVFLLFAYQGASTSEARMINSGCLPLVVLGACALFIFPIFLMFYVGRIVWSRVKPQEGPVTFTKGLAPEEGRKRCWCVSLCRGFRDGWRNGHSIFEWADKGAWVSLKDEKVDLESRKFRIGFEPLFVDFTKEGAVYIIFLLFKWFALGIIAGLVTNGTVQTASLAVIYLVDIALLCKLRPFSNSVVQWVETVLVTADALTLGMMVWASVLDPDMDADKRKLDGIYAGCMLIQTLGIFLLTIPIYADTFIVIFFQIRHKASKLWRGERTPREQKSDIKGSWGESCGIFCVLVRENFIGCVKESVHGPRRKPRSSFTLAVSDRLPGIKEEEKRDPEAAEGIIGRKPVRTSKFPIVKHGRGGSGDVETGDLENMAMLEEGSPPRPAASPGRRQQAQTRMAAPAHEDMTPLPDVEWQGAGGAGRGGRRGPRHWRKASRGGSGGSGGSGGYEEVRSGSENNSGGSGGGGGGGGESSADDAGAWSLTPGSHRQQAPVAAGASRRQPPPRRRGGGAAGGSRGRVVLGHVVDVPRREKVFPVSVSESEGSFDRASPEGASSGEYDQQQRQQQQQHHRRVQPSSDSAESSVGAGSFSSAYGDSRYPRHSELSYGSGGTSSNRWGLSKRR